MSTNNPLMKLGRKAIKTDSRTLRLTRYFTALLPAPPPSVDWSKGVTEWGMMENDVLGDCTCAGVGHAVQVFSLNGGTEAVVTDVQVRAAYEEWCGYNPSDPSTDAGGICLDILNAWKKTSFHGHHIAAFATANPADIEEIQKAINIFGGCYIGFNVPNSVMENTDPNIVWDVVADDGGIDGGHCVFVVGYDIATTIISFISWGTIYRMTFAFWAKYVDEAYAAISRDFIAKNGLDPQGFNLAQLEADLAQIN